MTLGHLRTLQFCGRLRARGHALKSSLLDDEWEAVDAAKRRAEAEVAEAVRPVLAAARADAAAALESTKADTPAALTGAVFDLEALLLALLADISPAVAEAARAGFASGALRLEAADLVFDADRAPVRDTIARLLEKVEGVPETLRSRLDTVIRDGLASGLTRAELAAAVREAAPELARAQAEAIAETTGTGAFEAGQLDAFREADADAKRWLSQRDKVVREAHDAADGQEVGLDEPFVVGGEELMHPGDPDGSVGNVARCRCTSLPVIRAKAKTWRDVRNDRIRADYPALRDDEGQTDAIAKLAAREGLSESYVRDLIYRR